MGQITSPALPLYPASFGTRQLQSSLHKAKAPTTSLPTQELTMTQGPNRILDELAKLMTDVAGAAQGARREVSEAVRSQGERFLNSMDLVKREEFDAVMEMARKAREQNDTLSKRVEALEAQLGIKPVVKVAKPAKPAAAAKPKTKKAAPAK
jgi:BMFP domain-containing protein YqiC